MSPMSRERQDDLPRDEFEDEEDALPAAEPALDLAETAPGALKAGIGVMPSYAERMTEKDMLAVAQFVAHATGAAK